MADVVFHSILKLLANYFKFNSEIQYKRQQKVKKMEIVFGLENIGKTKKILLYQVIKNIKDSKYEILVITEHMFDEELSRRGWIFETAETPF